MMVKKKGQTLILMVILIPIMIGVLALVVDVGYMSLEKIHLKEVTKTVIKDNIESLEEEKIKEEFRKNKVNIDNLEIDIDRDINEINIKNKIDIESIFGVIIGIKEYEIKIDITGILKNGKVKIE